MVKSWLIMLQWLNSHNREVQPLLIHGQSMLTWWFLDGQLMVGVVSDQPLLNLRGGVTWVRKSENARSGWVTQRCEHSRRWNAFFSTVQTWNPKSDHGQKMRIWPHDDGRTGRTHMRSDVPTNGNTAVTALTAIARGQTKRTLRGTKFASSMGEWSSMEDCARCD